MSNQQRSARKRIASPYQREDSTNVRQQQKSVLNESPAGGSNGLNQQQQWSPVTEAEQSPAADGEEDMDEYAMKRLRNNAAVSRTRQKKRMEQAFTSQRVKELREENTQLERTLDTMRRELALLKEMVVVCAAKGDEGGGASAASGGRKN